ncbi:hypothetical protein TNCV_944251 [Trichonephila clavipes]|nr:hypothetical protein TNCV_944251 [Trichonephila clavipes]
MEHLLISVFLYVTGWIWHVLDAGLDVVFRFYGRLNHQISHRDSRDLKDLVYRDSDNTYELSCLSACCTYFGGHRIGVTCELIHSAQVCHDIQRGHLELLLF